ncbi:PKD domain-containing protein, partial [Vicingus serpentipes]
NSDNDSIAENLNAGNYSITVTDDNGCIKDTNGVSTEPSILTTSIVNTINTFCGLSNGSALSTATGGTAPYSFLWSNGDTTALISNVLAGNYYVTITDNNGCSNTDSITLIDVPNPKVTIDASTDVLCFGENTGTATASASLGIPPYEYMWAPSGINTSSPSNLMAGTHIVTLIDGNGCTSNDTIFINEPTNLEVNIDSLFNADCNGNSTGEIFVSGIGGSPQYDYQWSNGETTPSINNLISGNYTVTITDSNNCTVDKTIIITEPEILNATISSTLNELCIGSDDGQATVTPTGGSAPYFYSWNSSPIQTTQTAVDLPNGTYSVIVTDINGCIDTTSAIINSPTPVIINDIPDVTICNGNNINLSPSASGGNGGYLYFWNNSIGLANPANVSPSSTTQYIVTAIDQNGCTGTSDTVIVNVQSLDQSDVDVIVNSPICQGTNTLIYATVNNPNTGPLSYSWNNGLGNTPGAFQIAPNEPTTYIVTVSNACGVVIIDSSALEFKPLPNVLFSGNGFDCAPIEVIFNDLSTTPIDSIVSWNWDFGDGEISNEQNPSHTYLTSGNYDVTLTVSTDEGCVNNNTIINSVTVHPNPIADFTATPFITDLDNAEIIFIDQSDVAISYLWDFADGETSPVMNPIHTYQDTGTYNVNLTVTNSFGCEGSITLPVIVKPTFNFEIPNAFTPNPNGQNGGQYDINSLTNDIFYPFTKFVKDYHLMIFNRWGELIFESFDINKGWDGYLNGVMLQQDVYVWKINLTYIDGSILEKAGDVTLIR